MSIELYTIPLNKFWEDEAQRLRIPSIQRQFVWSDEKIRDLLDSIMRDYPIGAVILWEPTDEFPSAPLLGQDSRKDSARRYVLDGQQRLTALSLVFNDWEIKREDKTISRKAIRYVPETDRLYTRGIDVSLIVKAALADPKSLKKLHDEYAAVFEKAIEAVGRKISNYQLPIYVLKRDATGERAYEEIAEIFTRINSAGVKIGNLDMFMSFFAAAFPERYKKRIISIHDKTNKSAGLDLDPLVRFAFSRMGMTQNQITKHKSFSNSINELKKKLAPDKKKIDEILDRAERAVSAVFSLLSEEMGISTTQFLPSENTLLTLFDYAYDRNAAAAADFSKPDRRKMVDWFLAASFYGAYSSWANAKIEEGLEIVRERNGQFPLKELRKAMKNGRPSLPPKIVRASVVDQRMNILRGSAGHAYLMLLAVLLHRNEATDWAGKNVDVDSDKCDLHHIFPRELLKEEEYEDGWINNLGNLTFIDNEMNKSLGDTPPEEYLEKFVSQREILDRHMIPSDKKLWKLENFRDFLDARLKLIWKHMAQLQKEAEE
jgi:hypothetical protein